MKPVDSYLTQDKVLLFVFGFVLQLISKGSSLFSLTFNIDDIIFWSREYSYSTLLPCAIRDGRFVHPLLGGVEGLLGINPPLSFTVSTLLFMACISASAIAVCSIWGLQRNRWASFIVIGFISLHPYLTDFYTWRIATFNGGLPFVFAFISLILGGRSTKVMPFAIILFALSLGIHQIPLAFCATTIACAALFLLFRHTGIIGNDFHEIQLAIDIHRLLRMVCVLTAGSVVYVLLAKIYISHGGIQTLDRDKIILFEYPSLVLFRISELFSFFSQRDPFVSPLSRLFFIAFLSIFVTYIWLERISYFKKCIAVIAMPLIFTMATLCAIGLSIVSVAWIPVLRNIFSISLIWAAVAVVAFLVANRFGRRLSVILVCFLFLAFAAKDNEMLTDQMRANQRDYLMMNRIVSDIEKLPNFKFIQGLAFIGTNSSSLHGLRSAADLSNGWNSYGTTLSLFAIPWKGYLVHFFNELTGYELDRADVAKFTNACSSDRFWPQAGSVFSIANTAVVCLGGTNEISFSHLDARHQGIVHEK